jgi:hypothetical protein
MKKNKNDPCWKNYIQLGTKKKDGKEVPNCVSMKEAKNLKGTPVVSLYDFDDKDQKKDRYGRSVPKKIKAGDPRVRFIKNITKTNEESELDETTLSADKKPQNYRDPVTGKTKVRMVRHSRNIIKNVKEETITETIKHDRYMRSHGKKAKGEGNWMFTSKSIGEPSKDEVVSVRGTLNAAGAEAAKKLGVKNVYVMEETDTTEKNEMAENQLYFIAYAAEEILDFIDEGGEVEEWYQNKLSKVHSEMESLHSYVEGEMYRTGMKEEVELSEAETRGKLVGRFNTETQANNYVKKKGGSVQKVGNRFYVYKKEVELDEKLHKNADAGDYVRDFRKSDAPQFKGKSKEKRAQMAIAAYMGTKKKMDEAKLDKVQPSELKKKFADRKDKDINNDGKVDSSDEYLHKRRQAIAKNVKEETITENVKKVASKLSSSKDPSIKKLVALMNSGKEPSAKEVMSLKGAAQDSVIQAFAEVLGPEATMKKFGIKESREIALHSFMNFIEEKRDFSENKSDYELYHKDFSTAVQHASKVAEKRGYKIDTDDWDRKVAIGPRKPSEGKTNSYSIDLMDKLGKQSRKKLQMQVYNKGGSKPFELNMYIQ